jgi:crotonobetainyl-CoA:carnitine CoA-transferase CaiB-like acyl-CoA transferase
LSIQTESEWKALCRVMGDPGWIADEKFSSHHSRKKNEDELDLKIGEWTTRFTAAEVMSKLQSAGVKAAVVNTMKDVYTDPQLSQRPQCVELEHPEIGKMHYQRPPFLLTKTPPGPAKRDPLLAEHNEYFYRDLLGLTQQEYSELVAAQVIY